MTEFEDDDAEHLQAGRDEERADRDEAIAERIERDQKLTESLATDTEAGERKSEGK